MSIYVYPNTQNLKQQWDLIYKKDWKNEPIKGELNKIFGLYVERDFHIESRLPMKRYIDLTKETNRYNMIINTDNGSETQKFYFDQKSRTIRTRALSKSGTYKNK